MPITVPTFTAGMVPTAAQYQQLSDGFTFGFITKVKSANQSRTSNTTLTNVTDLAITVAASTTYKVEAALIYAAATTGDMKIAFTWPASATFPWGLIGNTSALAFQAVAFSTPASGDPFTVGGNGSGNDLLVYVSGTLTVAGTAGTLQLQFAQGTSDVTATTIKVGSWMSATIV